EASSSKSLSSGFSSSS
ncbi:hypothetical protein pipiens_019553, partial [Culex pipiens pipiens]